MGILSKLMGWDATQQYLDHMQEAGHQAWREQQETSYPRMVTTCTNCGASMEPDDEYCGQCGTYGCSIGRIEASWPSIDE